MSTLAPHPLASGIPLPAFVAPGEAATGGPGGPSSSSQSSPATASRAATFDDSPVLITGGAGFIGCNLADHLLSLGRRVRIFDNISRPGVERNLTWLRARHGERLQLRLGDMRDPHAVEAALRGVGPVFHFAAQVAVTTSLTDPGADFDINARGTLNLLEAIRRSPRRHGLVFTSTNKVYGHLEDVALVANGRRYEPADPELRHGFDESRPVSFHSPYGCSKGAADQYVLDYARTFGVPAVVFRMSCIYGPHQCGNEDQGWIAHFLLSAIAGRTITLYGDGRQVRDALHVDDLVDALLRAQDRIDRLTGRAFNLGGGPARTTSLLELMDLIRDLNGAEPAVEFAEWRAADQRYYVSDIRRFCAAASWTPRVNLQAGVARLHRWLVENARPAPELAAASSSSFAQ
jgi:CDP-paratose 2-epimerase